MIKIEHIDGDVKVVTKGAYKNLYKDLGYKVVSEKEKEAPKTQYVDTNKEKDIDEDKNKFKETDKRK